MSDGKSKSTDSAGQCCVSTGRTFDATPTCAASECTTSNPWTLSVAGSPAKGYRSPELVLGLLTPVVGCGANTRASFANYDHGTRCWRTFQACLHGGLDEFSEIWPRSGTTRNGIAYLHQPLAPLTSEIAFGSFPTPDASVSTGYNRSASAGAAIRWSLGGLAQRGELHGHPVGSLHPAWIEQAMGYPIGWTDVVGSVTPSSRRSRNGSRNGSKKRNS
jgi:hypothetical protein